MHPALWTLIAQFRAAQDRGVQFIVDVLGPTLGVKLPTSNREWVYHCGEVGLYNVRWVNGVEVCTHGYGIWLIFPDLDIDFDWGDHGESDGFDVWRLWNFARSNHLRFGFGRLTYKLVQIWLDEAVRLGELSQDRLLCYAPTLRAVRMSG
jgi:hypothetical protein